MSIKMTVKFSRRLILTTRTCIKASVERSFYSGVNFYSTSSSGRKSILAAKIPALTLATLMTVKFPPVMSTAHNTQYCSSYSGSCGTGLNEPTNDQHSSNPAPDLKTDLHDAQKTLSPLQYHVTQEAGTERAFTGKYYDHWKAGIYTCVVCGASLFGSESKYNSGSGWPSFHSPYAVTEGEGPSPPQHNVVTLRDTSHGMVRDEVRCKKCGSHLGHVFDDGPPPSGLRYCINSAALDFKSSEE